MTLSVHVVNMDQNGVIPRESDLGDFRYKLKTATLVIAIGFLLSGMLVASSVAIIFFPLRGAYLAGGNLPFDAKNGWSWLSVIFGCFFGVLLLFISLGLVWTVWNMTRTQVDVFANGFRHISGKSVNLVLWSQITLIRQTVSHHKMPFAKGWTSRLMETEQSFSYSVYDANGNEYQFGSEEFGRVLRRHAQRLSLPWELVER